MADSVVAVDGIAPITNLMDLPLDVQGCTHGTLTGLDSTKTLTCMLNDVKQCNQRTWSLNFPEQICFTESKPTGCWISSLANVRSLFIFDFSDLQHEISAALMR